MDKDNIAYAEDRDRLIIRNSIKYLHNLTFMDSLNVPTVKSLYRTKCRLMELRRHMFLPEQKAYRRCEKCFMNFSEGQPDVEIQPVKLTAFAQKVIEKVERKGTASLTPYQKIYYKKLSRQQITKVKRQNKLVITCGFCKKPCEVLMDKPKPPKPKQNSTNAQQQQKKKKKKKRKDKLCGLDESVVFVSSTKPLKNNKKISNESIPGATLPDSPSSKLNETVSMANVRALQQTPDVRPLGRNGKKKKQNMRVSRKKPALATQSGGLSTISKAKDRLNEKSMSTLTVMLMKGQAVKSSSKLKQFLDSF